MDEVCPTSHYFMSQRLAHHHWDWGNSNASPLIMVHGGRDHARSWDWLAHALRDEWHVVCPDLRGHGDSAWSPDGAYSLPYFVADLAQLIDHIAAEQVTIVGHSLGGAIALRYAGLYPERVRKIVAIEGLGLSPQAWAKRKQKPVSEQWRGWIEERRNLGARPPRRYANVDEAYARMCAENSRLSPERARHLTEHGLRRNEDGTYSWKFDNYVRSEFPLTVDEGELHELWHAIDCPVWLVHGADSWASHPGVDGRATFFRDGRVTSYENAGHWVHHDCFDAFLADLRSSLAEA